MLTPSQQSSLVRGDGVELWSDDVGARTGCVLSREPNYVRVAFDDCEDVAEIRIDDLHLFSAPSSVPSLTVMAASCVVGFVAGFAMGSGVRS